MCVYNLKHSSSNMIFFRVQLKNKYFTGQYNDNIIIAGSDV